MSNMKDSGIEWIGLIPGDWEICRIKDKYQLITGFTPDTARDDFYDDENGYTWISIADMTKEGKNISESSAGISDVYIRSKHPAIVRKGSLLYSFKLSVGKVGFAQKELYTNEAIASFQENNDICLEYLYYAAFLIEENANINIYGAKILNQDLINNSVTIFPPLPEQQLIAEFLDDKVGKIDDILADLKKQVELLQKYKKSVITKAVTKGLNPNVRMKDSGIDWIGEIPEKWDITKIKYLLNSLNSGTPVIDENIGAVKPFLVYGGGKPLGEHSKYNIEDTIVIGRVGANCGCVTRIYDKAWATDNALVVDTTKNIDYIFCILNALNLNDLNTSTAQPLITSSKVMNVKIPFSFDTTEQQEITDYLDDKCTKIDELIKDKEAQIEKMEKYKKSLIYEYVTGKKRVKEV